MLRPTFSRTTALLAGVTGVAVAALLRSRSSASAAAMAAVPQAQRAKPSDVAGASLLPLPSSRAEAAVTGDSLFASRPAVVLCTRRPG